MTKRLPERRRHPRVTVGGRTSGKVNAVHDVSILDISLGGMLIEHAPVVQPGIICDLVTTLLGHEMRLRCRVARSAVHRVEVNPGGKRKLIYRTGLEFLEHTDETRQVIRHYIKSVIEEENGGSASEPDPLERGDLEISDPSPPTKFPK
jgi:hypothetical protein